MDRVSRPVAVLPVGPLESANPGIVSALTHAITPTAAAAAMTTAIVRSRNFWTPRSRATAMLVFEFTVSTRRSSTQCLRRDSEIPENLLRVPDPPEFVSGARVPAGLHSRHPAVTAPVVVGRST